MSEAYIDLLSFQAGVTGAAARVSVLTERGRKAKDPQALLDETLLELQTELEELQVANEELRIQNEALIASTNALSNENRRFNQLLDAIPDPCILTDPAGKISVANMAACRTLNIEPVFIQGKVISGLVPVAHRKPLRRCLTQLKTSREPVETEFYIKPRKTAEPVLFKASAMPLRGYDDQPSEIRWILTRVEAKTEGSSAGAEAARSEAAAKSKRTAVADETFRRYMGAHHNLAVVQEPRGVMEFLASQSCEMVGGYCYLSLLSPDKKMIIPVTAAAASSVKTPEAVKMYEKAKAQKVAGNIAEQVLKTQQPSIISKKKQAPKGLNGELFKQGPAEMLIVPLRARSVTIGVLTLMRNPGEPSYTVDDLHMVQNLADHAGLVLWSQRLEASGLAIDNAVMASRSLTFAMCRNLQGPLFALMGYAGMLEEQISEEESPEIYSVLQQIVESDAY